MFRSRASRPLETIARRANIERLFASRKDFLTICFYRENIFLQFVSIAKRFSGSGRRQSPPFPVAKASSLHTSGRERKWSLPFSGREGDRAWKSDVNPIRMSVGYFEDLAYFEEGINIQRILKCRLRRKIWRPYIEPTDLYAMIKNNIQPRCVYSLCIGVLAIRHVATYVGFALSAFIHLWHKIDRYPYSVCK